MLSDWVVWPIFVIQALAIIGMLLPRNERLFRLPYPIWVGALIIIANIAIVISLAHDSTDVLHLYF